MKKKPNSTSPKTTSFSTSSLYLKRSMLARGICKNPRTPHFLISSWLQLLWKSVEESQYLFNFFYIFKWLYSLKKQFFLWVESRKMQGLALQTSNSIASSYGKKKFSFLNVLDSLPSKPSTPTRRILPFSSVNSSLCKFSWMPFLILSFKNQILLIDLCVC